MNYKGLALSFDGQDQPIEAAWAYEIAVKAPNTELELFLNLTAVYLTCTDPGYGAAKHLPIEFEHATFERALEVLQEAENRFGQQTEIEFWRLYIRERVVADEVPDEEYERLAQRGGSLMPYYGLYISSDGTKYRDEAKALLAQVQDGSTARKRWIKSVLESAVPPRLE